MIGELRIMGEKLEGCGRARLQEREGEEGWVCDQRAGIMGEKVAEGRGREEKGEGEGGRGRREEAR